MVLDWHGGKRDYEINNIRNVKCLGRWWDEGNMADEK